MGVRAEGVVSRVGVATVDMPMLGVHAVGIQAQVGAIVAALPALGIRAEGAMMVPVEEDEALLMSDILGLPSEVIEEEGVLI